VICPLLRSQNVLKYGFISFAGFSSRFFLDIKGQLKQINYIRRYK